MPIPLSLYIHMPWCQRKCPYCDFNSHAAPESLPEQAYLAALIKDLEQDLPHVQERVIESIYIGGGTPSLFSATTIAKCLDAVSSRLRLSKACEITLEANPGTLLSKHLSDYCQAGVNRLSLGVQSFQDDKLQALGRIHTADHAVAAIDAALQAGFNSINVDLMYGLPGQSLNDALYDLKIAIELEPQHISWYQLTLEPNTVFYKYPPVLPKDDLICDIELAGRELLAQNGFQQYEVSAYAKANWPCRHNVNYWQFGDYLGIGAGAHGKVTDQKTLAVTRLQKVRQPKDYLDPNKNIIATQQKIESEALGFEFMLNALRLFQPIQETLLTERTGLTFDMLATPIAKASAKGLVLLEDKVLQLTPQGKQFLNDAMTSFL